MLARQGDSDTRSAGLRSDDLNCGAGRFTVRILPSLPRRVFLRDAAAGCFLPGEEGLVAQRRQDAGLDRTERRLDESLVGGLPRAGRQHGDVVVLGELGAIGRRPAAERGSVQSQFGHTRLYSLDTGRRGAPMYGAQS